MLGPALLLEVSEIRVLSYNHTYEDIPEAGELNVSVLMEELVELLEHEDALTDHQVIEMNLVLDKVHWDICLQVSQH